MVSDIMSVALHTLFIKHTERKSKIKPNIGYDSPPTFPVHCSELFRLWPQLAQTQRCYDHSELNWVTKYVYLQKFEI